LASIDWPVDTAWLNCLFTRNYQIVGITCRPIQGWIHISRLILLRYFTLCY